MIKFCSANEELAEHAVELLDSTPMSGKIRLATSRPAGLLPSLRLEGRRRDVLIACTKPEDLIVGIGIRSEKECFVDGRAEPDCVGYLSALRLREGYRGGLLLGRGYQALHDLHRQGKARYYLTTVLANNQSAMRHLTSGRVGLPVYQDRGEIRTLLINPRLAHRPGWISDLDISEMRRTDLDAVVQFLRTEGPRRQFFPCYRPDDFGSDHGLLPGLAMTDILLARDKKGLAGCVGVWDQSRFKSWNVAGYGLPLRPLRRIHNLWTRWRNLPSWPVPGKPLNMRFVSLFCVREDNTQIGRQLIQAALRLANERRTDILAWSLHELDAFQALAARIPASVLKSRLFLVHWPQDLGKFELPSASIPPYLETGSL